VSTEYLLWWFKDSPLRIPLVITLPPSGAPGAAPALPRLAAALFGDGEIDTGMHHGARFTAGGWLDKRNTIGVEAGYFFLASHTTSQNVPSDKQPILAAVPFPLSDTDQNGETIAGAVPINFLNNVGVLSLTSRLQSAEANAIVQLASWQGLQVQGLSGFRFLELRENLGLTTNPVGLEVPGVSGEQAIIAQTFDHSDTQNQFIGWQLGARADYRMGPWSVSGTFKTAAGNMYERVGIGAIGSRAVIQTSFAEGTTGPTSNLLQTPLGHTLLGLFRQSLPGGIVLPSDLSDRHFTRERLTFVPEVGINVGYEVTSRLRVYIGYNLLYVTSVVRPGNPFEQINGNQALRTLFPGNPVGPGSPLAIHVMGSEFWAQGMQAGIEFRY
jgi:hypothetical protein